MERVQPGRIRDAIVEFLSAAEEAVSVKEIEAVVTRRLGTVAASSIRSYLGINTPETFIRTERGHYKLNVPDAGHSAACEAIDACSSVSFGNSALFHDDCIDWMRRCGPRSIHAVVTDPPYGLVEYSDKEQEKLRNGKGGVWRIPPSFDGARRSPLPRFTTLSDADIAAMSRFFEGLGLLIYRVTVPGANVIVASNPLVAHYVAAALSKSGLEPRGAIIRLVTTMRGGDRPKNAHVEFSQISVMPRSMWEPWLVFRRPLDGRAQDNLRRWKTGGFRRPSDDKPFGDVIRSHPTNKNERRIAPHPSLKPQAFLRQLIRAVLPLGEGTILDPFAGSGSTVAAAVAVGYSCYGIEKDARYFEMAVEAIPKLVKL